MLKKKYLFSAIFPLVVAYQCTEIVKGPDYYEPDILATHFNGEHFVGSNTCIECHAEIYEAHSQTAHFHTSAPANAESIKGSFEKGSNTLELEELSFEMIQDGESYYQKKTFKNESHQHPPQKIDIVMGSGNKGQSYLSWEEDKLFQLQASWYPPTETWINSPGFPPQDMKRPIRDGCLKCHVTFATNRDFSGYGNQYDTEKMVYRVDCEKCHRPAAKHVIYHRKNPEVEEAKFILKLDTLPRQKRLDVCAQCHSGLRSNIIKGNSFSFLAGENLNEYARNFYTGQADHELDVHGNQYGLLTSSQCFKQSPRMDCSTCHNPHANQRGDLNSFNQTCIDCHHDQTLSCSAEASVRNTMENSCISCHMPNSPSKSMSFQLGEDSLNTPVYVRTHLIDIYDQNSWQH